MKEEMYILFEKYCSDQLSSAEKLAFESQLKSDSDFAESFKVYKETSSFLQHKFTKETADFKQNLKSIAAQHSRRQGHNKRVFQLQPWVYAATASVVLFFGLWFMQGGSPEYGDYNQHENAYFTERGEVQNELKLAQEAFNGKRYKVAIANFEIILKHDKRPEIQYFYAISLLEENQFNKAETIFYNLSSGESIYKEKALWYLALTKLKQQKLEDCKLILKKISSDSEDYDKAQKLLGELE